jgi:hypothetical protein
MANYPGDDREYEQHEPGAKNDHDKIDMSLLGFLNNALLEVCRVMDYGQTKYTRGGFLEVPDAMNRYTAAMWRHWLLEQTERYDQGDPFYDTVEGIPYRGKIRHDAQVAVNALFRLEYTLREEAYDTISYVNACDIPDDVRKTMREIDKELLDL